MNDEMLAGGLGTAGGAAPAHPAILVIGLGNPILGDDGVGWRVAEGVLCHLKAAHMGDLPPVEVDCLSLGGLGLMERMLGYERVVIIDSTTGGNKPPGSLTCLPLGALDDRTGGHIASAHDTSLQNAIEVGRLMGAQLPHEIILVLMETEFQPDFSDKLTPPVEASIPAAEQAVLEILDSWLRQN